MPASYTPIKVAIARNLVIARRVCTLTQHQLAARSGIARATIAHLEAGRGDPKLSTLHELAVALEIHPALLILTEKNIAALVALQATTPAQAPLLPSRLSTMRQMVQSGVLRLQFESALLGAAFARENQFPTPEIVGAAIGSFYIPGKGTLAVAAYARLLTHGSSAPASALTQLLV